MKKEIITVNGAKISCVLIDDSTELNARPKETEIASSISSLERSMEFLLGRTALRLAAKELGLDLDSVDLTRDTDGLPILPANFTGSISHTSAAGRTWAFAAVAQSSEISALGVDIESVDRAISKRAIGFLYESTTAPTLHKNEAPINLHCLKEASFKYLSLLGQKTPEKISKVSYKNIIIKRPINSPSFSGEFESNKFGISILKLHPEFVTVIAC